MSKLDYIDDELVEVDPEDWATKKVGRILRTNSPNRAVRSFCSRHVFITEGTTLKWQRGRGFGDIMGKNDGISVDPFLERIASIDGVTEIICYSLAFGSGGGPYALSIYIAPAFDWDAIEPEIFRILVERDEMMQAEFGK